VNNPSLGFLDRSAPTPAQHVEVGDLGLITGGHNSGNSSSGTAISSGTAPASALVTSPGSALAFNLVWDSSVSAAPAAFMSDIIAAAKYLESQISSAVTITLDIGYGEIAGSALGSGALGESESYMQNVSYANLLGALNTNATDATNKSILAALPAASPVTGNFWLTTAQAEALGLAAANGSSLAGYVGFAPSSNFTYGDTATTGTVASGTYDFFATAVHEMTEVMGRVMLTGESISGAAGYSLLDLLHYSGSGVHDFKQSTAGYLSVNGGVSSLGAFNTVAGGDAGDWASSVGNNSFDAYATSGVLEQISANDITEMNALGWTVAASTVAAAPAAPTGVLLAPQTSTLAAAQAAAGLTAGTALFSLAETGGKSGDSFTYTLGGAGAASFRLSTSGSTPLLSTGSAAVAGAANGKLYALTLTVNDTTAAVSSPAIAVDVIIGAAGNDAITPASLSGITPSAPVFIYGLAGNDTINGTGMTGTLFMDGGAGADTMTGGSGANIYEYGAVTDSTPSLMDVITNFNAAKDMINLTGLGINLTTPAALTSAGATLTADTIKWQVSGGNTFIYVNDTSKSEVLSAANMKIELKGNIALSSGNFAYL